MNETIDVEAVLRELPAEMNEQHLLGAWDRLAARLQVSPESGREMVVATARDVTQYAARQLEPAWGGGWRWNLANSAVRTTAAAALIAAVFASGGLAALPPLIYPAIIPLMFDLERVRLRRSEERLLEIIGARPRFIERIGKPEELYASLPDWVRNSVSLFEFEDFLKLTVEAGRARASGSTYEILPTGEGVMRITIT